MGFTFTLLMPKIRPSAWFLIAAGLCWLLLLLSTLSRGQPIPGLAADWLPIAAPATTDRSGRGDQAASRLFRQPGSTPD